MKALLTCLVGLSWLIAGEATAAPRISLIALSPTAEHALLTYNQDWVEVSLRRGEVDAHALKPPLGCHWTSMAYAPSGEQIAMTAFCPADIGACRDMQSLLLLAGMDRTKYRLAAERSGVRWGRIYWRGGGAEVLAQETQLTAPMATNLADLGTTREECERAQPQLISLSTTKGRRVRLDLLPQDWRLKRVIAADGQDMLAEVAVRRGGPPEITASVQLEKTCAEAPLHNLCRSSGVAVELFWRGGDWQFASPPEQARLGRMVASADLNVIGREQCQARWVDNRFRPICVMQIARAGKAGNEIVAPDGMFGDLALSADGRWMLAVATGIGRRLKQFDLFDTTTGSRRAFPRLLLLAPPFATSGAER